MERILQLEQIDFAFKSHPLVAILGSRQCGKTTLAGQYAEKHAVNQIWMQVERKQSAENAHLLT